MKESPILMNGAMVRATLSGAKTQTRRIMSPQPSHTQFHKHKGKVIYEGEHRMWCWKDLVLENIWDCPNNADRRKLAARCPLGQAGDRLWVRENWHAGKCADGMPPHWMHDAFWKRDNGGLWYPANGASPAHPITPQGQLRPSIHMPRWASRITLEITEGRVELLNEISEEDAKAEGVAGNPWADLRPDGELRSGPSQAYRADFHDLWDSIYGRKPGCAWADNPFVWAITSRLVTA